MEEELDITKLKYVLYARKSTTDETRQVRSIPDQIKDCMALAKRLNITIVGEPLTETKTAKIPDKRPVFTQMLKDILRGKYDAILAWNPDRLARNMLEGGVIINMVDEEKIKDLKFVTHYFTKDANGKMLLGMAFVLSKQYSDDLSQKVTRGVRNNFLEGKTPIPKHGYFRDKDGIYRPDSNSFELIQSLWKKRLDGYSYEDLVNFLNENGYVRVTKTEREIPMTKQMLTDFFKDPFYYGILIQNGKLVDLRTVYDFIPMITEELYNQVQQLTHRKIKSKKGQNDAFYPLKQMVVCSSCNNTMYIGPSTGNKYRYLFARCGTKGCPRKNKSMRMIKVFNFIYDFLDKGLNFTEDDYNNYYENLSQITDEKREKLTYEIHSKQGAVNKIASEIKERSLAIIKVKKNSEVWKINENRINELTREKLDLELQIKELKEQIITREEANLSLEEFLNLSKNASMIVQSANAEIKDAICRLIFLNLTVDGEKVLSYQAKEPFATLLKQRELSSSRG